MAMEFKTLSGKVDLPGLGIGTWGMGGWQRRSQTNDQAEVAALRRAIEAGLTHIDTAEMYGAGHAEELVREALRGHRREQLFITSKKWADDLNYDAILASCKASLKRLGTNYLDLYLLHFYNPAYPLDKAMLALDNLQDQGYVKHIGVSNFSLSQLKRARRYARHPIAVNQVQYNLMDYRLGAGLLPYCKEHDILLVASQPLKRGLLAGTGNSHRHVDRIVEKYQKTHAQVALRWLLDQEQVVTIPRITKAEHLEEDLGALGWQLEVEDWKALTGTKA